MDDRAPITVLHVIDSLGAGGAERSLAELLAPLRDRGIDSEIAVFHVRPDGFHSAVVDAGWPVHHISQRVLPQRVSALRALVRARRPSLIHTTLFDAQVAGSLAGATTGTPVLASVVNTTYSPERLLDAHVARWKLEIVRRVDRFTSRRLVRHLHAITEAVKDSAVTSLGVDEDRVTVVPRGRAGDRLGVPSTERRMRARRALDVPDDAEVVVNVGRQENQKGQRDLLLAVAELLPVRPRLVALVAGRTGNATPQLEALHRELRLGDRLRLLGHRADVPEILATGDVFAFPSLYEGLGGAVIEAMALGLPIVATDLPALREVVLDGENAALVPVNAPQELAAALARVLDDAPLRARWSSVSRERFEAKFTLEPVADQMAALYRRILAGGPRDRSAPLRPAHAG